MTYMLRDLPDGQVEITISRPLRVGILSDRDMAARFVAFLQHEEPDLIEEQPPGFATAQADSAAAVTLDLDEIVTETPKPRRQRGVANLPVLADVPTRTALLPVARLTLTDAQREVAFARLGGGESIASVAPDFGLSQAQLRGAWGHHCKVMQRHLAEGGQQPCSLCQKPFTPSISHPDTCARCSHE